jgi:hypothetical protein
MLMAHLARRDEAYLPGIEGAPEPGPVVEGA